MRRLLLGRLFVGLRDGEYLTRPHGRFGFWRRVTGDQRNRLIDLYLYAVQGAVLLVAFGLYRQLFGDSAGFEDMFSAAGFTFGVSIFMAQAWVLADAPKVSAPAAAHREARRFNPPTPAASPFTSSQAAIVFMAVFAGGCVFLTGLVLRETDLSIAGGAATAVSGLLLCREVLRVRRSRQ